jgi:DNA-binding transcriptional LysR family regulator
MGRAEQISRRLKLRHLNVLLAVAEAGSMAKAAEQLAISQPVVSKAIADLEQTLGVRLVERGPRGVEPTVYGRALLKRSAIIQDELLTSVSELENLADPAAGELRIGSTEAMGASLIPVIIDRMSRQYPRITFEVVLADPATLRERELRGRRVDLVIGQRVQPGFDNDDLNVTILYRDRLCVVAGTENPWARRRKIALADLVEERWCLPPPGHPIGSMVIDCFRRSGLRPPQNIVTSQSAPFTSSLIANGQFLGILGSVFLGSHVARAPLKVLPVRLPIPAWPISIVTLKNRAPNPVTKLFVDCVREVAMPLVQAGMRH